ncbi:MAG: orotate phosphoribosyltransferase [Armatimonadota bacterium]|jgi:orotate phosphoribosyltransferase|nr:orotate phosphoribosyltransferase [Armatimonadota bacterium]MDT7972261.1 orotate phosphoribosyltransferase [Armatimonadota bacterium]
MPQCQAEEGDATMLTEATLIAWLQECGALLRGHFLLTSGLHSDRYVEKFRLLERPQLVGEVCAEIVRRFAGERIDAVLGPAVGGIVLAFETARQLGCRYLFAETENGRRVLRRGFTLAPDEHVLLVEDVVTTGGSLKETLALAQQSGAHIVGVAVLIDRGETPLQLPVRTEVLARLPLRAFPPDDCPLCRQGIPLQRRGSQR